MSMGLIVTSVDLSAYQAGDPDVLLEQATALVRSYCGWHLAPSVTETVTIVGSGRSAIMLPSLHVTAIESVVENAVALTTPADYEWDESGVLLRLGAYWTSAENTVTVTFTHGHDSLPDVESVIMAVTSRAQANPDGVLRRQTGLVSEMYSQSGKLGSSTAGGVFLSAAEKDTLNAHRLPRII